MRFNAGLLIGCLSILVLHLPRTISTRYNPSCVTGLSVGLS